MHWAAPITGRLALNSYQVQSRWCQVIMMLCRCYIFSFLDQSPDPVFPVSSFGGGGQKLAGLGGLKEEKKREEETERKSRIGPFSTVVDLS